MPAITGSIDDPEFRRRRARHAAAARTTLDHHVAQVVSRAGELTDAHVDQLRALLPPGRCGQEAGDAQIP